MLRIPRRELSHEPFVAKIGADTEENEPSKVGMWRPELTGLNRTQRRHSGVAARQPQWWFPRGCIFSYVLISIVHFFTSAYFSIVFINCALRGYSSFALFRRPFAEASLFSEAFSANEKIRYQLSRLLQCILLRRQPESACRIACRGACVELPPPFTCACSARDTAIIRLTAGQQCEKNEG